MIPLPKAEAFTDLRIRSPKGEIIPFILNPIQQDLLKNLTGRDIVIKPRQEGITTLIQGIIYMYIGSIAVREQNAITIPQHFTSLDFLRRRFDCFYQHDCRQNKPYMMGGPYAMNADNYHFPQTNNTYYVRMNPPNVRYLHIAHLSEYAHTDSPGVMDWIEGKMVETDWNWIVIESTPKSVKNSFYEQVMAAYKGKSKYALHFYQWWRNVEYVRPLGEGDDLPYDDIEKKLVDDYDLTPEQINWRRHKKVGMEWSFSQEYPENIESCFG